MYEPFYSDIINQHDYKHVPANLNLKENALSRYCRRYLYQKLLSVFDVKGLPDSWCEEYFKDVLFIWGSAAIFKTDKFGVIPQACGYYGYDVFYHPTHALISNPLFSKTYQLKIGSQCEIIRLTPDWCGIADIIGHYADRMSLVLACAITNLYNSRLSYVFTAENQAIAESFKKMYEKITDGEPAVVIDKKLFNDNGDPKWVAFQQNLKQVYIVDMLQAAYKAIENDFYSQIGIPNANYEKKERLLTEEIVTTHFATQALSELWLKTLNETAEKANAMFDLNIKFDYNEKLKEQIDVRMEALKAQANPSNGKSGSGEPNSGMTTRASGWAKFGQRN